MDRHDLAVHRHVLVGDVAHPGAGLKVLSEHVHLCDCLVITGFQDTQIADGILSDILHSQVVEALLSVAFNFKVFSRLVWSFDILENNNIWVIFEILK